jgi:anti-anti-sigma factor
MGHVIADKVPAEGTRRGITTLPPGTEAAPGRATTLEPSGYDDKPGTLAQGVRVCTSLLRLEGTFDPACLHVDGEVDLSTSEVFAATVATMVERGVGDVWVDLRDLDFIDVAGMRALASAACRLGLRNRRLVLRSVAPHLARLMDLVGWSDIPGLTMIARPRARHRAIDLRPLRTGL